MDNYNEEDLFQCERCSCTMLKSACEARLNKLIEHKRHHGNPFSFDVHCIKCDQGKEITGLYVDKRCCKIKGCRKDIYSNGFCINHYRRYAYEKNKKQKEAREKMIKFRKDNNETFCSIWK